VSYVGLCWNIDRLAGILNALPDVSLNGGETMNSRSNKLLISGLFGLALLAGGCTAKDVDVRTQGDSTSVRGRSQVNTESQSESGKTKSSGQTGGSVSGSGSGSVSGSGSGSATGSGSGTIQR
jgi:hypothetical protein